MNKFFFVSAFVMAPAALAAAHRDIAGQLSVCHNLRDGHARLKCYDAIATKGEAPSPDSGVVFYHWSGTGMTTTRPFQVEVPWELQWNSSNMIQIYLYRMGGDMPDIAANQMSAGKGRSYEPRPGEYYMKVNALGDWKIRIVAAGP